MGTPENSIKKTKPLKESKIKNQLIIGFGLLLTLLFFQGVATFYGLNKMGSLIDTIYNHPFQISNTFKEIHVNITRMHRDMKDIANAKNLTAIPGYIKLINEQEKEVYRLFESVEGRYLGNPIDVTNAIETFKAWKPIRDSVITLSRSGRMEEAYGITIAKGANHVDFLIAKINIIERFALNKAIEIYADSKITRKSIKSVELILSLIVFTISVFISIIVVRSNNRSISTLRRYQREVSDSNKALENKNKELQQFTYITSHDLQEPLNSILSFSSLLKQSDQSKLDKIGQQSVSIIEESATRMKEFIVSLLEYSRIGRVKEKSEVNIRELLLDLKADLNDLIQREDATIEYIGEDLTVSAYKTDLLKLFQNLIVNGIKYRKDSEKPFIVINAKELTHEYQFSIADNGIGIEKEYYEQIFEVFRRLHTSDQYSGTGIGLAHCKKIVEFHQGKISLESTPGKGSKFYFTISKN